METLTSLSKQVTLAALAVRPFLSVVQISVMKKLCQGEEKEFFMRKFIDLSKLIETMPKTYDQEGMGEDAVVHLHYFLRGSDWYIMEKDVYGGVKQAFGYAVLNGDDQYAECGYISIEELTRLGAELNLHFLPCRLADVKAKRAA